jgi:tungstate transport system ATP-binding protein|tara:strand:+ start:974 stop:1603 length:630 start_codon:yes stop_codon:yes gene_type:complete
MENISLNFKKVSFAYKKRQILRDIDIKLSKTGMCVIYGDNGAGKTTLLRLMAGFLQPENGYITYCKNLRPSFIFQKPVLLRRSIEDNLLHALMVNNNMSRFSALPKVKNILSKYDLTDLSKEYAFNLSGGQQQMISIVRALIIEPNIIFCDEPTSNLDTKNKILVEDLLKEKSCLSKIVLITQNGNQSKKMADEVYELENCKLNKVAKI